MKKPRTNNNSENQLKFDKSLRLTHQKDLGLEIPKDYFSNSKQVILDKISDTKVRPLFSRRIFLIPMAAAVALILALVVFKPNALPLNNVPLIVSDTLNQINTKGLVNNNTYFEVEDVSIAALFVDDDKIDDFVNDYVLEDVIKDASVSN
ncbi:hypothetical protein [Lutibacter sp.]|uniref:hypothetical protein n=1 Tax=Lutibacter sp. TaxID=1925666 RepID=UPI0025BC7FCE|nr:hypothetical protein [Lutibacter sp.]MCF6181153.1 hypothetical protein [Lutibacter sp.]